MKRARALLQQVVAAVGEDVSLLWHVLLVQRTERHHVKPRHLPEIGRGAHLCGGGMALSGGHGTVGGAGTHGPEPEANKTKLGARRRRRRRSRRRVDGR